MSPSTLSFHPFPPPFPSIPSFPPSIPSFPPSIPSFLPSLPSFHPSLSPFLALPFYNPHSIDCTKYITKDYHVLRERNNLQMLESGCTKYIRIEIYRLRAWRIWTFCFVSVHYGCCFCIFSLFASDAGPSHELSIMDFIRYLGFLK